MMKGLPASGKSTRAEEIVRGGGSFIRVNRDLLRTMLHFDKWSGYNEGITVNVEKAIVLNALTNGMSVVVDDTNLNPGNEEMWKQIALSVDAKFEVEPINTNVGECLTRDALRAKPVGRHVIMKMAMEYKLLQHPDKAFVVCDLDGTIANIDHRLKFAKGDEKDWDTFFSLVPYDSLRTEVFEMLKDYASKGFEIVFVSARPERCRKDTEKWLYENGMGVPFYTNLFMRQDHDKRDDVLVKGDMFDKYFKDKYKIETVIDDRPKVIRMWQERGVPVIDVGAGIEF